MKRLIIVLLLLCNNILADTFNISNVAQSVVNAQYTNNVVITNIVDLSSQVSNTNNVTNSITANVTFTNIVYNYITNIVGVELPTIPGTGTSVLKAVNGVLTWVAE